MKAIVIINEQHTLLEEQKEILNSKFDKWEFLKVPAAGWTLEEQKAKGWEIIQSGNHAVFVSPLPAMLASMAFDDGFNNAKSDSFDFRGVIKMVHVFHNDKREKKELPNGTVISVTAETGWQLV